MPTRNFVVQNGLTVGPLTIDAATGSITTSGNVNITGNLGVTQIARNDSSISLNDTGGFSNVLITVDGSLKANVNPLGFDITNGNIRMNNNWLIGTGGINSTGNILGAVGSFGSINSPGFINTSGNVSAAVHTGGAVTVTGFINTSGNVSGAVVNAGALNVTGTSTVAAINSTGFINTTANVSAAVHTGGAVTVTGTINTAGNVLAAAGVYNSLAINGDATFPTAGFQFDTTNRSLLVAGIDADIILRGITNEPDVPSAGNLVVYSKSIGGRMMLKQKGPSGSESALQYSIAQNKIAYWTALGGTTGNTALGFNNPINFGTQTGRTVATTNSFTRMRRVGFVSGAGAGAIGGHIESNVAAQSQYTIGNGSGFGGFYYVVRFGIADATLVSGSITFVGLTSSTALVAPTTAPSTFTNSIGIGHGSGETVYSIYYGGSAAQTPISLGASFPTNTVSTDMIELILFAGIDSNNTVNYSVLNLNTNAETSGTLTGVAGTALPASTTFLSHRASRSNNATATAVALDIVSVYIETDY